MPYLEQLNNYGFGNIILLLICVIGAIEFIISLIDKLCSRLGLETKWSLKRQKNERMIQNHEDQLNETSEQVKQIIDKINVLSQMMIEMQTRNDTQERARLKDRIAQSYRYYHEKKKWTQMDKEAFEDLINSYELSGGSNSFVHSICEPESFTWEIIDD